MENATPYDVLEEKWQPVLETNALPAIGDHYKSKVTSVLLENTEKALREAAVLNETPQNNMGGTFLDPQVGSQNNNLAGYDPVLISLVRPDRLRYCWCAAHDGSHWSYLCDEIQIR